MFRKIDILKSLRTKKIIFKISYTPFNLSLTIICHDADLDLAVKQAHLGLFFNQGQVCIAGSRLFVHEKIHDEFVERMISENTLRIIGNVISFLV